MNWDCLLKDLDKGFHCNAYVLNWFARMAIKLTAGDGWQSKLRIPKTSPSNQPIETFKFDEED